MASLGRNTGSGGRLKGEYSETSRKVLHIAMGGFALLLAHLTWWQALILALVALLHNLYVLPRYARTRLFRGEAGMSRTAAEGGAAQRPVRSPAQADPPSAARVRDLGILLYPASIAILIVGFHTHLEIVAAAWGLLAFGDGMATIVGKGAGGPRLPWNKNKTWSGFLAFITFGFPTAWILYVHTLNGQLVKLFDLTSDAATLAFAKAFPQGTYLPWVTGGYVSGSIGGMRIGSDTAFVAVDPWHHGLLLVIAATTLLAAMLESLPIGVDDNILVPLASAGFLFTLTLFDAAAWEANRAWVLSNLPWAIGVNAILAAVAWVARSVDLSGVVGGVLMGGALYAFGGWRAFLMLLIFFVLGTAATKMGYARKAALGIAEEKGGRRGARNAIANCGMGALLAFVAAVSPYGDAALLALVAAFATAACDTVSSEIGQAWGRTPYLITSFRRVPPGTDGAVSAEGTLAGIAAALVVAMAAAAVGLVTFPGAILVVVAALFGSTLESYMGATWERSKLIDNEAINFANTMAGALFAIAVPTLLPSVPFLSVK